MQMKQVEWIGKKIEFAGADCQGNRIYVFSTRFQQVYSAEECVSCLKCKGQDVITKMEIFMLENVEVVNGWECWYNVEKMEEFGKTFCDTFRYLDVLCEYCTKYSIQRYLAGESQVWLQLVIIL